MSDEFVLQDSDEILNVIAGIGYRLYDITDFTEQAAEWHELEAQGHAMQVRSERTYILAPIQKEGQSLREAYRETGGVGPMLKFETLDDFNAPEWLEINHYFVGDLVMFSRISLSNGYGQFGNAPLGLDLDEAYFEVKNMLSLLKKHLGRINLQEFNIANGRGYFKNNIPLHEMLMVMVVI